MGTRRTMFEGVQALLPGHYLKIAFRRDGKPAEIVERQYWDFDFPDAGSEENPQNIKGLIDEFEATFRRAVEIRLRADVPVVGYLSGGVDSAYVLATASKLRGSPVPSFTIQVPGKGLDETDDALFTARAIGCRPTILRCDSTVIANTYPQLIASADCPVIDTSCAALWRLSQEVHDQGYKVALTGEGSDEAFAGYIWFKLRKLGYFLDVGGTHASDAVNRLFRMRMSPHMSRAKLKRIDDMMGRAHAQTLLYHLVSQSRDRYFSAAMKDRLGDYLAYEDVPIDAERVRRWDPLNQSLYYGYKIHLPGLLLNHKGDRVAMANSVETRYPFLDENVIAFVSKLHPSLEAARPDARQVPAAPGGGARAAEGGRVPQEGHVPRPAGGILLHQPARLRAPVDEPGGAGAHRLFRSAGRAQGLQRHRQRPGRRRQHVPQDGPYRRAVDAALAPPLHGRRPVRIARPLGAPAGRPPARTPAPRSPPPRSRSALQAFEHGYEHSVDGLRADFFGQQLTVDRQHREAMHECPCGRSLATHGLRLERAGLLAALQDAQ